MQTGNSGPSANPKPTPLAGLTARARARGKRLYYIHSSFNAVSWAALAEGVVILMILKLGGSEIWVGAVSALIYATMPFMLVGYATIGKLGVTGTAGLFWGLRSLSALLMLAGPWAAVEFGGSAGLWSVLLGTLGFSLGRAGGLAAFTGIITELTTTKDRGDMISNSSKISQGATILMILAMAWFLGEQASLPRFQLFILIGISCGLISAICLWNIPESGKFKKAPPFNLRNELGWLLGSAGNRWFFAMMVFIPFTQGIGRVFLLLLAKNGYGLGDQQALLLLLTGIFGGIAASYTYGLFLDRVGSRPLLFLTGLLEMLAVGVVIFLPNSLIWGVLAIIFFISGYVHIAFNAATQHYFISITTTERQLPQGIITQGAGGLMGGLALYLGGLALESLGTFTENAADPLLSYRIFFAGALLIMVLRTVVFYSIPRLQSQGIRSSLNALFSPRDWLALYAVKRAVENQSEDLEQRALAAMDRASAEIFGEDLVRYLSAPSIFVRQHAMDRLALAEPSPTLVAVLLQDLEQNMFTTARRSAYWLGRWQIAEAIEPLRKAVDSEDFMLRGAAIHALVDLNAREALPLIENRFEASENPYVLIEGARAISLWSGPEALAMLLAKYHLPIPPQTKDELSLSVARLLGLYEEFYKSLSMLHQEPADLFQEWAQRYGKRDEEGLVAALQDDAPRRTLLQKALERQRQAFQPGFFAETAAFLEKRPEWVFPEMALLMTFLLLTPKGLHRKK